LKIKQKGHPFDTVVVMEAESQAELRSAGNGAYVLKRTTPRVMMAGRPDGNTSPGNYGWLFIQYAIG
jgi:hypothetical protein